MTPATTKRSPGNPDGRNLIVEGPDLSIALRQAAASLANLAAKLHTASRRTLSRQVDSLAPLRHFINDGVLIPSPGEEVAALEILKVFILWCQFRDLPVPPLHTARRALGRLLYERYGVKKSHSVAYGGRQVRGFRGIGFRPLDRDLA